MNAAMLFLAMATAPAPAGSAGDDGVASSRIEHATGSASVRIVRSFRLTRGAFEHAVPGALKRKSWVTDRDGTRREADLIEFE